MDHCVKIDDSPSQLSIQSSIMIKTTNNEIVTLQLNSTFSSYN